MIFCNCILAGTAACRNCSNNPNADYPPTENTNTVVATDMVLITGTKTNADRIRAMTDEELAKFISGMARTFGEEYEGEMSALDWLKEEAKE